MAILDEKNCIILNLLQENCRMSLTEISKRVGLSVDSVKKRIDRLEKAGIFFPRIQLRPRHFGFPYIVDVKVKVQDFDSKQIVKFVEYMKNNPRVSEFFSHSGAWDFTIVIMAKDHEDLAMVSGDIRERFSRLIRDWQESLTTHVYKFESYDMLRFKEVE